METFLFGDLIVGPIKSRRLGNSLGINLLPVDQKYCNFNCVYCECGWNQSMLKPIKLPSIEEVESKFLEVITKCKNENIELNSITFAGNGEPTLHQYFYEIVCRIKVNRDKFLPNCQLVVLTNGVMLGNSDVKKGLLLVDKAMFKVDSAIETTMKLINGNKNDNHLDFLIKNIQDFKKDRYIQTMMLKEANGLFDNTTDKELKELRFLYQYIKPREVLLYSLDRNTPSDNLIKIEKDRLNEIANYFQKYNINAVAY